MKKSELIKKIANYLIENTSYMPEGNALRCAEDIVEIMEESGVKPPLTKRCPVLLTSEYFWEEEK